MKRISVVNYIHINGIIFSSIFQIGDNIEIRPRSNVFAVQRAWEWFDDTEGDLRNYPLFSQTLPHPIITERISMQIKNINPFIKVKNVKINGMSTAAVFQVGSNTIIDSEARIKHFRQLLPHQIPRTSS